MNENKAWTTEEKEILILLYGRIPLDSQSIAVSLGRSINAVQLKAARLGLSDPKRSKKAEKDKIGRAPPKFTCPDARRASQSKAMKARLAKNGHPRGALGMKHSAETRKLIALKSRKAWADPNSAFNSETYRQQLSDNMLRQVVDGNLRCGHTRARGGKREDLDGIYFRSAWEANYARYLNFLIKQGEISGWAFEPKTFEFSGIKRGTRAYTPDFRVDQIGGGHEWHEVKGWMDAKSKTRLARFARYFPNERLIVVDSKWFKSANKTLPGLIPEWENGTVRV